MIRVCTINDKEIGKVFTGRAVCRSNFGAIEEFGLTKSFRQYNLDSEKRNLDTEGEQETEET